MGQLLGVTQQVYSKLESGKTRITLETLTEVARVLNLDIMRIIEFDDAPIFNSSYQQGDQANNYFQNPQNLSNLDLLDPVNALLTENIQLKDELIELKRTLSSFTQTE